MCGIACILELRGDPAELRERAVAMARLLRHRGPDWSGVFADGNAVLAHERLSIVDVEHGAQPLTGCGDELALAVNGEIYNHRALRAQLPDYPFKTASDCEVILPLYEREGAGFLDRLSGIFAFVLYDRRRNDYLIARDPIGVMPLYTGRDHEGNLLVASELKALVPFCRVIEDFPPGHYLTRSLAAPVRYYHPDWREYAAIAETGLDLAHLRASLEAAVHRQLMCDVPYGVLISGGLDSSVIAAATQRFAARRVESDDRAPAWWPRLHSLAIGLDGSPDLAAARRVATSIESVHHEFKFTVQEGLDALRDVIWIDSLKAVAESRVSANQMEHARYRFPYNPPATREAYLYRETFESHFPGEAAAACVPGGPSIACSTPTAIAWDASFAANADPSGRAVLGIHRDSRSGT